MSAPIVCFDTNKIAYIKASVYQEAQSLAQLCHDLQSQVENLQNGDWVGESSQKFYQEMAVVLPALCRLASSMQEMGNAFQLTERILVKAAAESAQALSCEHTHRQAADRHEASDLAQQQKEAPHPPKHPKGPKHHEPLNVHVRTWVNTASAKVRLGKAGATRWSRPNSLRITLGRERPKPTETIERPQLRSQKASITLNTLRQLEAASVRLKRGLGVWREPEALGRSAWMTLGSWQSVSGWDDHGNGSRSIFWTQSESKGGTGKRAGQTCGRCKEEDCICGHPAAKTGINLDAASRGAGPGGDTPTPEGGGGSGGSGGGKPTPKLCKYCNKNEPDCICNGPAAKTNLGPDATSRGAGPGGDTPTPEGGGGSGGSGGGKSTPKLCKYCNKNEPDCICDGPAAKTNLGPDAASRGAGPGGDTPTPEGGGGSGGGSGGVGSEPGPDVASRGPGGDGGKPWFGYLGTWVADPGQVTETGYGKLGAKGGEASRLGEK